MNEMIHQKSPSKLNLTAINKFFGDVMTKNIKLLYVYEKQLIFFLYGNTFYNLLIDLARHQ